MSIHPSNQDIQSNNSSPFNFYCMPFFSVFTVQRNRILQKTVSTTKIPGYRDFVITGFHSKVVVLNNEVLMSYIVFIRIRTKFNFVLSFETNIVFTEQYMSFFNLQPKTAWLNSKIKQQVTDFHLVSCKIKQHIVWFADLKVQNKFCCFRYRNDRFVKHCTFSIWMHARLSNLCENTHL